jgi:hypothetical protein
LNSLTGEPRLLLGRKQEDLGRRVVGHAAALCLPAQPTAHVALLQPRALGDLARGLRPAANESPEDGGPSVGEEACCRHGGMVATLRQGVAKEA